jgi:aminoglycoside 3-N-acetyltransferase I
MSEPKLHDLRVLRARVPDVKLAQRAFTTMAEVFEEDTSHELPLEHVERLLAREDFWALVALVGDEVVGGLTAHVLPMTRDASSELFVFDLAVRRDHHRRGIGRALMRHALDAAREAGLSAMFVPVDDEDIEAREFYRVQIGSCPSARPDEASLSSSPSPTTFTTTITSTSTARGR